MVYKLGNESDLANLPGLDAGTFEILQELTSILSSEYGEDRDIDRDDGGYVLYAEPGTTALALRKKFDYTKHTIEYVNRQPRTDPMLCAAFYILQNEYTVVLVLAMDDAPDEILEAIDERY